MEGNIMIIDIRDRILHWTLATLLVLTIVLTIAFGYFQWWVTFAVVYLLLSFRFYPDTEGEEGPVQADEIAVRLIFGRPYDIISSGLPFAPLFIVKVSKLDIKIQQKEFPAEPNKIFRGDMIGEESGVSGEAIPEGMVPPERVTFRTAISATEAKKLLKTEHEATDTKGVTHVFEASAPRDGLSKRVTAEIVPVVRWRICDDGGVAFIQNIGSIAEANRQIEDEMFSVLQRLLPNISVGQAKQNFRWINTLLHEAVLDRTEGWGIEVETSFLKAIRLNHDLNGAIAELAEAEFKGRADRELAIKRGEGAAQAEKDLERAVQEGRAAGLKKMMDDLGISGEAAYAQFIAGLLAEGDNSIILGADGLGQLGGIAAALAGERKKGTDE
jgi:regulator of protease activity HflC (stomatin/prohibitin superfamily)